MTKQTRVRKPHPVLHGIGLVLSVILLAAVLISTYVLSTLATVIDSFFGAPSGHYSDAEIADTKVKAEALAADVEAEGTVLVQNNDNTLPLSADTKKVNVFGWASTAWLGGGSGSGGVNAVNTDLLAALTAYGIEYNTELTDMYKDFQPGREYVKTLKSRPEQSGRLYEPDISNTTYYTQSMLDNAKNFSDTAIVVIGRLAGESNDATKQQYKRTEKGGDIVVDDTRTMLELTTEEENLLTYVGANYAHVLVLINSTNVMELGQIETIPGVDACLIAGLSGSEGATAIPAVLWGDKEPSGRTADTWAYDLTTAASYANAGMEGVGAYADAEGLYPADGTVSGNLDTYDAYEQVSYVDYAEGIYIGYKWYETADAEGYWDGVSNEHGTGYDAVVQYPFGYGLSYTSFDWSDFKADWSGDTCTAQVTVTNTGDVSGKDVVEVYVQSPYTDYDKTNGVEKPAVELVGYGKTAELAPGASETVSVTFTKDQLKAYDANGAKTYILDAGNYYITAAKDAHEAVNNVLAAKGKTAADGMTADGDAAFTAVYTPANTETDTTTYATDSRTGAAITNQLDAAKGDAVYLTRSDWTGTFPKPDGEPSDVISTWGNEINGTDADGNPASYQYKKTADAALVAQLDSADSGNPTVGDTYSDTITYGAKNGLSLIDLRGKSYDDPMWNDLLDQLTAEDYYNIITCSGYGVPAIDSVGKPFVIDADTASGLIYGGTGAMFPNMMTLAQTWNQDLALEYGTMIGNEAVIGGCDGWYAPSMNIHRTPFSGRNGEYYSEDPFLSGTVASKEVYGAATKGLYAYIKHFAFNDQENHRGDREGQYGAATWLNEQSAREIYLKPFEMCMKLDDITLNYVEKQADGSYQNAETTIPAAMGVMTAFNRIGATWTGGSYALITGILRTEWGFNGAVITDNANTGVFMLGQQMIEAGADMKLTYDTSAARWDNYDANDPETYHYAREALHHVLYTTANTKAMNHAMPGSVYKDGPQIATVVRTVVNILCTLLLVFFAYRIFRVWKPSKRKLAKLEATAAAKANKA